MYLTDLDDFEAMSNIYKGFFVGHKPARATIEVSRLPKGALVEIEAVAIKHIE